MQLLKLLVAGPACVVGLRMTSGNAATDYPWFTTGGSNSRSGAAAYKVPWLSNTSQATWTFKEDPKTGKTKQFPSFSGLVRATPLVDDKNNIYMSTVTSGMMYKLNSDGKQLWAKEMGAKLPGSSSLMGGKLFGADATGTVFTLDMETGDKVWSTKIADKIADDAWSVATGEGLVLVPAFDGKLVTEKSSTESAAEPTEDNNQIVALDATTGEVAWKFNLEGESKIINALISIRSGSCVFSDNQGYVYRVDLKTGKPIWKSKSKKDKVFSIGQAILDPKKDVVYSTWNELGWEINHVTMSGRVGAFDFGTGEPLWTYITQYPTNGPPAVGTWSRGTHAVRVVVVATGYPGEAPDPSMGVFSGQGNERQARVTLLGADAPHFGQHIGWYTMKSWNGAAQGDDKRPDPCMPKGAFSAPTFDGDGNIIVGYQDGRLIVINDADENTWLSGRDFSGPQLGSAFAAAPVVAPGMLIAAPCDGLHVWKFDATTPPASM